MPRHSNKIAVSCAHCGAPLLRFPYEIRRCSTHYCNRACYQARVTVANDFWSRVEKTESCWLWTGAKNANGYGHYQESHKNVLAHRRAWELTNGPIPEGLYVCHNCPGGDNRGCVNPAHLFLGTHADNMADMRNKGRAVAPQPKMTARKARAVRLIFASGEVKQAELARAFGVSEALIHRIVRYQVWRHAGPDLPA